jgi:hypothetical protein
MRAIPSVADAPEGVLTRAVAVPGMGAIQGV